MKILAVSDQVEERLYSPAVKSFGSGIDLLVGCGDLPYEYLEYLLNVLNVPMIYVPGNHDPVYSPKDPRSHVEGAINIDLKTIQFKGLLLAGMGGSIRYRDDGVNQYGQTEMYTRALRLVFPLLWNRARYGRALDILVTQLDPLFPNAFAHPLQMRRTDLDLRQLPHILAGLTERGRLARLPNPLLHDGGAIPFCTQLQANV